MHHPHYRAPVFHHPLRIFEDGEDIRICQAEVSLEQAETQMDAVFHTLCRMIPAAKGTPSSRGAHSRLGTSGWQLWEGVRNL